MAPFPGCTTKRVRYVPKGKKDRPPKSDSLRRAAKFTTPFFGHSKQHTTEITLNYIGLSYPTSVEAGQQLFINSGVEIEPTGTGAAVHVSYYLSADSTLDAGDILINPPGDNVEAGNVFVDNAPPFRIPASVAPGTYHIIGSKQPKYSYTESPY